MTVARVWVCMYNLIGAHHRDGEMLVMSYSYQECIKMFELVHMK